MRPSRNSPPGGGGRNWKRVAILLLVCLAAFRLVLAFGVGPFENSLQRDDDEISRAEAEALLDQAIAFYDARDRTGICKIPEFAGACSFDARTMDSLDVSRPIVVGVREPDGFKPDRLDLVLELCMQVNGRPLYSDFYVTKLNTHQIQTYSPVYWIQRRVEDGDLVTPVSLSVMKFDERCGPGPEVDEPITREAAEAVLKRAASAYEAGDDTEMCTIPFLVLNCYAEARTLSQVNVSALVVVGFRAAGELRDGGDVSRGGVVLELCMLVNGQPLYNEFYVNTMTDGRPGTYSPAYWIQRLVEDRIVTPGRREAMKFDDRCGPIITAE